MMTPQQIVGLILRLVALSLVSQSIGYIFSIPKMLTTANLGDTASYAYIVGFLYIFGAALLWFFPMWIAHKIVPRTSFENKLNLQPLEAARVGCSLIGLWLFVKVFAVLVWFLFRAAVLNQNESMYRSLDPDSRLNLIINCIELVLALVLIFRSGTFSRLVIQERNELK
jgi:hypothetical protein